MMSMKALTQQVEEHVYLMAQQLLAHVATDHGLDHSELVRKYLGPPPRAPHGLKDGKDAPAPVLVAAQQEVQRVKAAATAPKAPPVARPEKQLCQAQTAKGTPCKFSAQCQGFCKKHYVMSQSQGDAEESQGAKKTPKTKSKVKPRHEHLIEEEHEVCGLCESHGDVTVPGATREEYEVCGGAEITKRLRAIMAPEPEEPEDPPEPVDPDDVLVSELIDDNLEDPEEDLQARLRSILAEEDESEDEEDPEDD
jgi:hypothetical protein